MARHDTSTKLLARLRAGESSGASGSAPAESEAPDSPGYGVTGIPFVDAVREQYVRHCRRSGSQQHRLRYQGDCWLVTIHRWVNEQLAAGATREDILAMLAGVVEQLRADLEARASGAVQTAEVIPVEVVARDEILAGAHDDLATHDAMRHPTADALRRGAQMARSQIVALERKAHAFTVAAFRLVQFGATRQP